MSDLNCFVLGLVELVKNTIANTISPDSILFSFFKSRFHKWKKMKELNKLIFAKNGKKNKKKKQHQFSSHKHRNKISSQTPRWI